MLLLHLLQFIATKDILKRSCYLPRARLKGLVEVSGNSTGKCCTDVSANSEGISVEGGVYRLSGSSKTRTDVEDVIGFVDVATDSRGDEDAALGSTSLAARRWLASNSSCMRSRSLMAISIAFWKADAARVSPDGRQRGARLPKPAVSMFK